MCDESNLKWDDDAKAMIDETDEYSIYQNENVTLSSVKKYLRVSERVPVIPADYVWDTNPISGRLFPRPPRLSDGIFERDEKTTTPPAADDDDQIEPSSEVAPTSYWYDACESLIEMYRVKAEELSIIKRIRRRDEICRDKTKDISSGIGHERLRMIYKTLDSFGGVGRAAHQVMLHEKFIQSCLPHIYGAEWEYVQQEVLERHRLTKIDHEVMVITPRRFGKTWSVAMVVAALLLCVPGIRISVVSTGSRASSSLKETVVKFIEKSTIHNGKSRIIVNNKEELFVAKEGKSNKKDATQDTTSRLLCFPSNSIGKKKQQQHEQRERERPFLYIFCFLLDGSCTSTGKNISGKIGSYSGIGVHGC